MHKYSITTNRPVFKLNQPNDDIKYQPLPAPTGDHPYRLKLETRHPDRLTFHVVGDTGGITDTDHRHRVASAMTAQLVAEEHSPNAPEFLFHLGDVVYNFGEAKDYARQFFTPYRDYDAHIFAIAGNHDSDVNPLSAPYKSLDAFKAVFCGKEVKDVPFGNGTARKSGIQPHIYWTLETPLAIIIGMHSNVPKYGIVTNEQRAWLAEELIWADTQRPGKALLIAIHHAPYSADVNHGSSLAMIKLLEEVFDETGIRPDLVMSGHVHNYQRFKRDYAEGRPVTYLVAGAGGYDELHTIVKTDDPYYTSDSVWFDNITLQAYKDNKHGFLKLSIEKATKGLMLKGEYYSLDGPAESMPVIADSFEVTV